MFANLRNTVRDALPPKVVHAYRVLRHTVLLPTEWEMVAVRQFIPPDQVAVDVGANFGLFTSVLLRYARSVVSFEPNPACAEYLASVMPTNCEIIAKAVSASAGRTTLRLPVSNGIVMDALATIEPANRFETEPRLTNFVAQVVATVTLDEVLLAPTKSTDRVAFVNIDAEGHEFAVLRGGERLISAHRPVLLVELEYRHGAAVIEVFEWLKARRYVACAMIEGHGLAPIDPAALLELQDEKRLACRLAGKRRSGYVNNVFFLPED